MCVNKNKINYIITMSIMKNNANIKEKKYNFELLQLICMDSKSIPLYVLHPKTKVV